MADARRAPLKDQTDISGARALIVEARFYDDLQDALLDGAVAELKAAGLTHDVITVPGALEIPAAVAIAVDAAAANGKPYDAVIALGGGVIGDLAGFAAAVVRRGMQFVQMPTSLLAQVDSSVGGKTGINAPQGKNLIGAFYQPRLVLADTGALDTLPKREFRAGYAEVVKYGLIDRPDFFSWLEANWPKIEAGGPERIHAIAESCRAKADVVARDERETGDRALLNLGHTFGHALEAAAKYDPQVLVHGEGVAIGLVLAHQFSSRMNLSSPDDANRVAAHLETAGLPTNLDAMKTHLHDAETMLGFIRQDKKVTRGALNFILTHGIGQSFIAKDVPESEVRSFLAEKIGA